MAFIKYNENPYKNDTIDCVMRGIAKFLDMSWDDVYIDLMVEGFVFKDMPHRNYVWDTYLREKGFYKVEIPNTCPDCTTVERFCLDHPRGRYLLGTGSHVVAIVEGNYYDTWDSGQELPVYYYTTEKQREKKKSK
jgi:hypothetical protein